jgi:protein-S-isoprenylcysteine O-methyltransferase Ste14
MRALELKIPPPVVALLVAGAMWGGSLALPASAAPTTFHALAAIALALAGGVVALSGVISFRRAQTTVNPMKPERTASLVSGGIYSFTRNPTYLGLLLVLIAFTVYLSSIWQLVGPVIFVLYMNRFQVAPEERVLSRMFGVAYTTYQSKVRRWL